MVFYSDYISRIKEAVSYIKNNYDELKDKCGSEILYILDN